ncbi:hypothetical protein [Deinococcus seoulensis]|nr:hypothetical protein [Deinococcus seoulensis]
MKKNWPPLLPFHLAVLAVVTPPGSIPAGPPARRPRRFPIPR